MSDIESLRREIEEIHARAIQAHLQGNAAALVADQSKDFISISNGRIRCPTIEETREGMEAYLRNTRFSIYQSLRSPIVGFSSDCSMAWSIVEVRVAGERDAADGEIVHFDTTWAWVTLFRRTESGWERLVESSSWRPSAET